MKEKSEKKQLTVRVVTPITSEQARRIIKDISDMINLNYSNKGKEEVKA